MDVQSVDPTVRERSPSALTPPPPRGPLSARLIDVLATDAPALLDLELDRAVADAVDLSDDILLDDDLQLALFLMYELSYGGIAGVADDWEWDASLLTARGRLEAAFEHALRAAVAQPRASRGVPEALFALVADDSGPSLSAWVEHEADLEQVREILAARSIYTLKEADPHSWAIPRLKDAAKVALVEIQYDEYGSSRPDRMHATIFARCLRSVGLDDHYGAYLDHVPVLVLTSMNLMSLFGLHRRLRGAIVGHLAAYEMTSSLPCRAYANGLRRLGLGEDTTDYFDEHVAADAVHEQIAARDLAGGLAEAEPALADDILFGASACLTIDGMLWGGMRAALAAGRSALRKSLT
ncbi:MAG: iron-containing redox enzyme family protein [Leifsonia sp.]